MNAPFYPQPRAALAKAWAVKLFRRIEDVEVEWRELFRAAAASTFQQFEFMRLWYEELGRNGTGEAVIALVERADSGVPVAIFPMVRKRRGLLNWLELADSEVIDYCIPLLSAEHVGEGNIGSLVAALISALPGDLLYINKLPERLGDQPNPLLLLPNKALLMLSAWSVPLRGRYERETRPLQSAQFRSGLGRKARKLARERERSFEISLGKQVGSLHYELLTGMRAEWFSSKGRTDILVSGAWRDFYRRLIEGEAGAAQPWIATLRADDQPLAVMFGLADRHGAISLMPASQRGEWTKFAPGLQLFEECFAWFDREGFPRFDLSIGDNPYKQHFAADRLPLYDMILPKTLLGKIYYKLWKLKVAVRNSRLLARMRRDRES